MITPANGSEREALQVISTNINGMVQLREEKWRQRIKTACSFTYFFQAVYSVFANVAILSGEAILGDKGYIGQELKDELATKNIDLQTPLKKNMHNNRSKVFLKWITSTRQLTKRFVIA